MGSGYGHAKNMGMDIDMGMGKLGNCVFVGAPGGSRRGELVAQPGRMFKI